MVNFQEQEQEEVERFLRSHRLVVKVDVVEKVLLALQNGSSKYSLWKEVKDANGDYVRPVASKNTVAKIAALYESGVFDGYLNCLASEGNTESTGQAVEGQSRRGVEDFPAVGALEGIQGIHIDELLEVADSLRLSLEIPGLLHRLQEPELTVQEFQRAAGSAPGGDWYWGWQVETPTLRVEALPSFGLLREHGSEWDLWSGLEQLKQGLGDYVGKRENLLAQIQVKAREETGLTTSEQQDIPHGSITPAFTMTIYEWAMQVSQSKSLRDLPRYVTRSDIRISASRHQISFTPVPDNRPLCLGDIPKESATSSNSSM